MRSGDSSGTVCPGGGTFLGSAYAGTMRVVRGSTVLAIAGMAFWFGCLVVGGWKTVYASASVELQSRRHEKDSVPALDSGVYVSGCLLDMTVI